MDLLEKFREIFPDARIAYLCAEPESKGKEWLTYLIIHPSVPFRLRIKANQKIHDGQKSLVASIVFSDLQNSQSEVLSSRRWIWGRLVYVSALRLDDGELLIIISDHSPKTAISDSAHRWGIETAASATLKLQGFVLNLLILLTNTSPL